MIAEGLRYGYTIGIVAPSGCSAIEKIQQKKVVLEELGFQVKEGKYLYDTWGYLAGRDEERARDLMEFFQDPEVDMILCLRGGYGATRILELLDYETIKRHPKILMGYSDITVLLNTIFKRTGLITFHGPTLTSDLKNKETYESLIATLVKGHQPYSIYNPASMELQIQGKEMVEGILVGGNLCMICGTMGTPYEIDTKDTILFIEDIGEAPYKIDRMLTQLLSAGKLQDCKGIILGQFTHCKKGTGGGFELEEVLEERLEPLDKPMVKNLAAGHNDPKLTLPIGARVSLDPKKKYIEVLEPVIFHRFTE